MKIKENIRRNGKERKKRVRTKRNRKNKTAEHYRTVAIFFINLIKPSWQKCSNFSMNRNHQGFGKMICIPETHLQKF